MTSTPRERIDVALCDESLRSLTRRIGTLVLALNETMEIDLGFAP